MPPVDIAIPAFGYQSHIAIDREHGLFRRWLVTDAAAYDWRSVRIPIHSGRVFRFEAGHRSDLMSATIPI